MRIPSLYLYDCIRRSTHDDRHRTNAKGVGSWVLSIEHDPGPWVLRLPKTQGLGSWARPRPR
eukprot:699005-Prymnesium_polylepis.1